MPNRSFSSSLQLSYGRLRRRSKLSKERFRPSSLPPGFPVQHLPTARLETDNSRVSHNDPHAPGRKYQSEASRYTEDILWDMVASWAYMMMQASNRGYAARYSIHLWNPAGITVRVELMVPGAPSKGLLPT